MRTSCLRLLVAGFLFGGAVNHASASIYTFFDLGPLLNKDYASAFSINNAGHIAGVSEGGDPIATLWQGNSAIGLGSLNSSARAINDSGQVAGWANDADYWAKPVRWTGTVQTFLPTLGGNFGEGADINSAGHVVGYSETANNAGTRATIWKGNTANELVGLTPGADSDAKAINNGGQVVGHSIAADGYAHATRWDNGTATDLGTSGYSSYAYDINDLGQVTGYSESEYGVHATRWNGTSPTDLGTLGGSYSQGFAINNSGQVVGVSFLDNDEEVHATLWNGNTAIDLNSYLDSTATEAGWVLREARGINGQGSIVGISSNIITGSQSAFLMSTVSPVPEPETYAMLLAGLGVVAFMIRRTKQENSGARSSLAMSV